MQESIIIDEILEISKGRRQRAKESLKDFKIRLIEESDKLTDDEWDSLTETTQGWINATIVTIKDSKDKGMDIEDYDLPLFPEESEKEREDEVDNLENEDTGKRIRKRHVDAMDREPKKTAQWHMKLLIAKNPNISYAVVIKEMEKQGFIVTKSTVYGVLSNFRQSMKVLNSLGMLNAYEGEEK